jgi:TPR repeat protein
VNKKLVLISTLLSITTALKACEQDFATFGITSTTCTQSTDQYQFEEAKKEFGINYPNGVDVIASLSHKGFEPAKVLYGQIRLFEEKKMQYYRGLDRTNAVEDMTRLSQDGFVLAKLFLEKINRYEGASLLKKSESKAKVKMLHDLSTEGFAYAQSDMGDSYLYGNSFWGVEKDEKKGIKLLTEAASQQEYLACWVVGCCYRDGRGVKKDQREAMRFWKIGCIED